jgi:hypothetical protein
MDISSTKLGGMMGGYHGSVWLSTILGFKNMPRKSAPQTNFQQKN